MRGIPGTAGLALGLLVAGCGGPGPPGTPPPATTGTATTASSVEPPVGSTEPASSAGPAASASASRTAAATSKTTGKPPPPKSTPTPTTAKPPAKGSPVRTAPIDIVGTSYAALGPVIAAQLADECGGTLCVTLRETIEGPPDPQLDCKVKRIIQAVPIHRGDTVTFVLADPCGGFTEPPPTG